MNHEETPDGEVCPGCGKVHTEEEKAAIRSRKLVSDFVQCMIVPSVDGFEYRTEINAGSAWFAVFQESVYQLSLYYGCPPKVMREAMKTIMKNAEQARKAEATERQERNAAPVEQTAPSTKRVQ